MIGRTPTCEHEGEVLELARAGCWPSRADAGLLAHAADCDICGDVVAVAAALAEQSDDSVPPLPDAAVVWFRARLRARDEAARRAALPVHIVQIVALAVATAAAWLWMSSTGTGPARLWTDLARLAAPASAGVSDWLSSAAVSWAGAPSSLKWAAAMGGLCCMLLLPGGLLITLLADRSADSRLR
jgi:hypothetical protein